MTTRALASFVAGAALAASAPLAASTPPPVQTFGDDVAFLKTHNRVVVLADPRTGARLAVCPDLQGRVMTSSARGDAGPSFGWVNRPLLASHVADPHFNPYGGEDRLWLGPEGSQFSIFFRAGDPFDLAHWQTPAFIDTERWPVAAQDARSVRFTRSVQLTNRSGTRFDLTVDRTIRLTYSSAVLTRTLLSWFTRASNHQPSSSRTSTWS